MDGYIAIYILLLAAIIGYLIVSKVPNILQSPFVSASSFINGIVLIGAMFALANAETGSHTLLAFIAVTLAAANAVGGFVLTRRNIKVLSANQHDNSGDL